MSRRRPRGAAVAVALALAVAACSNGAGVRTETANARGDSASTASTVADAPPSAPVVETTDAPAGETPDTRPVFTLPDLTLPTDVVDDPDTSPAPDPSVTPGGAEDLATAGDSLFPEVGNAGLDVTHYVVRIAYDPADAVINGDVTITATARRALPVVVFDAVGLDVAEVRVAGEPASFTTTDDELVIDHPLAAQAEVEVDVTYTTVPSGDPRSFGGEDTGWFATDSGSYVLNEPNGAREWMPADDHPGDKATWRFELTVPDGLAGIANGEQLPSVDAGPDTTWIWEQGEPMTTYLVLLLTGIYDVIDGGTVGDTPIVHVTLTADVKRMQPYFDTVAPQLTYFESVFGPYPLDRYGLAFTESFSGLAMETQGRSMFSTVDFPGSAGPDDGITELLLAHELAHQWFGDAVSPLDWADIWLNEAFASYGQWLWFDHAGMTDLDEYAEMSLRSRQGPREPTGRPSVGNLFGDERYDGGAIVLHALRRQIGDDDFFAVLQRWAADNAGTSRSTADFIVLAEEVANRSLTDFFDTWLFGTSLPAQYPS